MLSGVEWQMLAVFRTEKQAIGIKKTLDKEDKAVISYLNKRIKELEEKLSEPI